MVTYIDVCLEVGTKRVIASAVEWPGWCRGGKDADAALRALLDYGPRYQKIVAPARVGFKAPKSLDAFRVVERLKGNASTDFGVPGLSAEAEGRPLKTVELKRLQTILKACWRAFDAEVEQADGRTLRTGPRGGGRSVHGIADHVLGAEAEGYLKSLGGKPLKDASLEEQRGLILTTLEASARGEVEKTGPRGGKRWSPRYYVRRAAWHILDHVWEIQDRLTQDE